MKVLELYENRRISTAKEFKDSFTPEQWENIICYYISIMDKDVGVFTNVSLQDRPGKMSQIAQRIKQRLGPEMPDSTQPQSWRSLARPFGISVQGSTWDGFYNTLLPHVSHVCELDFSSTQSSDDLSDTDIPGQLYTTTETVQDILAWIPQNLVDPLTYNTPNSVRTAVQAMMTGAKATASRSAAGPNDQDGDPTPTWEEWVDTTATSDSNRKPIKDMLRHALNGLPDGSVSKQQIASVFLDWLRTADASIAEARKRYTQ
jgi:hypothetical protein